MIPSLYKRQVLPSGMVVLTERMPSVKSASIGVWVRVGSRDEAPEVAGVSHFIEHMLFKGTQRRSAQEIAKAIDAVGQTLHPFTPPPASPTPTSAATWTAFTGPAAPSWLRQATWNTTD